MKWYGVGHKSHEDFEVDEGCSYKSSPFSKSLLSYIDVASWFGVLVKAFAE